MRYTVHIDEFEAAYSLNTLDTAAGPLWRVTIFRGKKAIAWQKTYRRESAARKAAADYPARFERYHAKTGQCWSQR